MNFTDLLIQLFPACLFDRRTVPRLVYLGFHFAHVALPEAGKSACLLSKWAGLEALAQLTSSSHMCLTRKDTILCRTGKDSHGYMLAVSNAAPGSARYRSLCCPAAHPAHAGDQWEHSTFSLWLVLAGLKYRRYGDLTYTLGSLWQAHLHALMGSSLAKRRPPGRIK